jgi:IclR family KDG regulon transcriptional repressor
MSDATLSTVRNAARLLKAFAHNEELGVSELSRRLGLGKSKVHRLLTTLLSEGLVAQEPHSGRYRLSLLMFELGEAVRVRSDLHAAATPVLARLREQTGECAQLAVPDRDHVVYLQRMETAGWARVSTDAGWRRPMHCTSSGKVLLAHRSGPEQDDFLTRVKLTRLTRHTIIDPARLREELDVARARGWAETVNEREVGLASLAAPVRDSTSVVVAAISIQTTVPRYRGARRRLAQAVVQAGDAVSRRLDASERGHGW